ncbi:MAG TPA: ATP-binding protein [Pyrinomonadaceae bacterium]|nr:ATP-binding protein [Pyrinomonadaceae bacterium]
MGREGQQHLDAPHSSRGEQRVDEQRAIDAYEALLDRLAQLAQSFGAARDLRAIFRSIYDFAVASTPANGMYISLMEGTLRRAVYACADGREVDVSQAPPLRITDSPHGQAIATGRVVITDDYEAAMVGRRVISVGDEGEEERPPRSAIIAPMEVMGRTIGSIEVRSPEVAAFNHGHATAMRMAANFAAVAIENVRLLERELERAEAEAESEKMRSLGQLAAGVAHDFNNSLAAILGRTQLLLRTTSDERQRRSLQIIETASLDAAETVRRIQTFARRTPTEQLSPVSVSRLVHDAVQLTRTRWEDDARAAGVHYEILHIPAATGGLSDEIAANPSEMREVLVNLIFNALDAMPGGGRIEIHETVSGGYVDIEVRDTGCGIAPELRERIFEPFFTTKGPQGSGLGLAVSYSIIRRHGGQIEVDSEVGCGTTFRVRFPRAQARSAAPRGEKRVALPTRRVLVVEDEPTVRDVLVEMLGELEQQVTAAAGATEALTHLADGDFDLMITDLAMPELDGLRLAAEARTLSPRTKVVLATGYGKSAGRRGRAGSGGNDDDTPELPPGVDFVITKPFRISDLEAALGALYPEDTNP